MHSAKIDGNHMHHIHTCAWHAHSNYYVYKIVYTSSGLALAADQNFKTFQAAYPYVVQKLLYDNSASTRRILYSVYLFLFFCRVPPDLFSFGFLLFIVIIQLYFSCTTPSVVLFHTLLMFLREHFFDQITRFSLFSNHFSMARICKPLYFLLPCSILLCHLHAIDLKCAPYLKSTPFFT